MWSIRLEVDSPHAKSLAASLATEHDVSVSESLMTLKLEESRAKDLRAMWNTRLRSLVIARNVIEVMDSSTPKE